MRTKIFMLLLFFCASLCNAQKIVPGSAVTVWSPDWNYKFRFYQKENPDKTRTMYYTVNYKRIPLILESKLDIQMDNQLSEKAMGLKVDHHHNWCENLTVKGIDSAKYDTSWMPVYGEADHIRDHYNAVSIKMVKDDDPIYTMNFEIRAYNEGVAFRYYFPENPKGTYYNITAENTEFSLPADTKAWFANWAQGPYSLLPLSNWPGESERPLTLQLGNGLYACLTEARMTDYARTKFKLSDSKSNTLVTSMFGGAELISPVGTPWRVIMAAEKPGQLIENDGLILNLNEPNRIINTTWIKPGKQIRVMTQTTADAKSYIDFAANHGLQYILFDWKWYGPAFSFSSDATKVAIKDLDMPGVIAYGKDKGIGVILYVNQQGVFAQSDSLFSIYHKWGIKGVKIGFVQVGSHRWTTWVERIIRQAAQNEIMLDIHDDWRPTGEQRTWPNLVSAEGIRGNEEFPDATHNTILPFTRFIAGPADYTICYFDKRIKTTHAHQLALAVIYFSGLQTLYWYDKPSDYHGEPELEFWDKIPTSWDETKVVNGIPGQYITTARRKGTDWFVGIITNNQSREISLPLNFLKPGKKYIARVYSDDPNVMTQTHVKIENESVTSKTVLSIKLMASGGQAIYLQEAK
jgi:hypothetical protein